jgi:hypothetical protein
MFQTLKPYAGVQNLYGQSAASPLILNDVDDTVGVFFVFPELSIRIQGLYTIACQLINVKE